MDLEGASKAIYDEIVQPLVDEGILEQDEQTPELLQERIQQILEQHLFGI